MFCKSECLKIYYKSYSFPLMSTNISVHPASNMMHGIRLYPYIFHFPCPVVCKCIAIVCFAIDWKLVISFWARLHKVFTFLPSLLYFLCVTDIMTDHKPSQWTKITCRRWAVMLCKRNRDKSQNIGIWHSRLWWQQIILTLILNLNTWVTQANLTSCHF